jgi:hypothetical protein
LDKEMCMVLHSADGVNENSKLKANSRRVRPHARLHLPLNGFPLILRAEHNMNHILSVRVGHVSHLRRLTCLYTTNPALTRWAIFLPRLRRWGSVMSELISHIWLVCNISTAKTLPQPIL